MAKYGVYNYISKRGRLAAACFARYRMEREKIV